MSKAQNLMVTIICGVLCCTLTGFLFFGMKIFNIGVPQFQFIAYGIVGATAFSLFLLKRYRDAGFILILLFILNIFMASYKHFITHLLFFSGIILSIFIFSAYFYHKLQKIMAARIFVLAGIISLVYIIITGLLLLLNNIEISGIILLKNMPIGFLIGTGLAIGFELAEHINTKIT